MSNLQEVEQLRTALKEAEHVQAELDRRVFHLKTLYDVSKDIYGSVETETILRNFLLMTMGNFGVMQGFIILLDASSKEISQLVSIGMQDSDVDGLQLGVVVGGDQAVDGLHQVHAQQQPVAGGQRVGQGAGGHLQQDDGGRPGGIEQSKLL